MGALFFDKVAVMGCRSAPMMCQETTSTLTRFMARLSYIVFNYVDDFMSIDTAARAQRSYQVMANLLRDLGYRRHQRRLLHQQH